MKSIQWDRLMGSRLLVLVLYLFPMLVQAQSFNQVGGTCSQATNICTKEGIQVQNTTNGSLDPTPNNIHSNSPSCFELSRDQSTYIKFTVKTTGTLEFTISPLDSPSASFTEYDWALYELVSCGNDLQNPSTELACNFFQNRNFGAPYPHTGMRTGGGPISGKTVPFAMPLTVTEGKTYLILIDNSQANGVGYTLRWGGSFDIAPINKISLWDDQNAALPDPAVDCCPPYSLRASDEQNYPGIYTWDFGRFAGDMLPSSAFPPAQQYTALGVYLIQRTLQTTDQCTYTASRSFSLQELSFAQFPTAFSPNGDGINDTYTPELSGIQEWHFKVYDRWGGLVWQSQDPTRTWDGSIQSGSAPQGIYLIHCLYRLRDGKDLEYKGSLQLLR